MIRQPYHQTKKPAFTLVELLIVIAILGALVALLLPALQAAREATRRTTCLNHARQIALATMNYASSQNGELPSLWRTSSPEPWANFSWRATILPYLDQQPLFESIDFSASPADPNNQLQIRQPLEIYRCPSTPQAPQNVVRLGRGDNPVDLIAAGAHDFVAIYEVHTTMGGLRGAWHGAHQFRHGSPAMTGELEEEDAKRRTKSGRLKWITDGLSKTALIIEQAGKPMGRGQSYEAADHLPTEGAWATCDIGSFHGNPINYHNYFDPYGFHSGAIVTMADASAILLPEDTPTAILIGLYSRDGSEIMSSADWQIQP